MDKVKINKTDLFIIRLAAILHDIGRYDNREEHARIGMLITRQWLENNTNINIKESSKIELLQMILNHTKKNEKESNYKNAILQDADALDEIGIMSIFMAGNRINREDAFYFNRMIERVKGYEIDFCNETYSNLNTKAGKIILNQKLDFIKSVIRQLESEISGTNISDNQVLENILN
jgi:HD superfamily phosphodiesterase